MAYLGKTPSQATRARYYYTATGGETSLSGSDDNGNTLVFSDGNYVDVMLNGVTLVAGTDYNTTTANTIGGLTALTASDVVEVVVYDTFSVFGGNVNGNFNIQNGTLTAETITGSGDMNIDSGTLFVDASENRVGIGTSSPAVGLQVEAGGEPTVRLNSSSLGITADFKIEFSGGILRTTTNDPLIFKTNNSEAARFNTSGNLAFPNGQGIDFSASESGGASSSILDDYEEGTWTPGVEFNGSSTGVTYNFQEGAYRKVGSLVYCIGHFALANNGSSTGVASITGLPFTIANALPQTAVEGGGAMSLWQNAGNNVSGFLLSGTNSATTAVIRTLPASGTDIGNATDSDIANTFDCRFYITYIAS